MPILRKRELREMLPEERRGKVTELRAELIRLRTTVASGGSVENPGRIRELKRTIARLLTLESQGRKSGEK